MFEKAWQTVSDRSELLVSLLSVSLREVACQCEGVPGGSASFHSSGKFPVQKRYSQTGWNSDEG